MKSIKIVTIAIFLNLFSLTGYSQTVPGELDTTFDGDGMVLTGMSGVTRANDVAIGSGGTIYAAGYNSLSYGQFAVMSYKPDGSMNHNFGVNGIVTSPIMDDAIAWAVDLQSDGRIVVAGTTFKGTETYIFVVRLKEDGKFDSSFGKGGIKITNLGSNERVSDVKVHPDGRIIVAGHTKVYGRTCFILISLLHDGAYEESFGYSGIITRWVWGFNHWGGQITIAPNGEIYQVGSVGPDIENLKFVIMRYKKSGQEVTDFGNNGVIIADVSSGGDIAGAVAIDANNKIIVVGSSYTSSNQEFLLVRFLSDGSIDDSFGINGVAPISDGSPTSRFNDVAVQIDGRIIASGHSAPNSIHSFVVARVEPNGFLDDRWGQSGLSYAAWGNDGSLAQSSMSYGMVLDSEGKPVLAGVGLYKFALARFYNDTPPL